MKMLMQEMCCYVFLLTGFYWGQDEMKSVDVTLCDLFQHPEQFTGRMVKVRAGSVGDLRLENILHDFPAETCPAYMQLIVMLPDQVKPAPNFQLIRNESFKELEDALHRKGATHIDATYEGRFDAAFVWRDNKRIRVSRDEEKGYGKNREYDGRIILHQVSDIWAKTLPRK
jgi:hypothetical protein